MKKIILMLSIFLFYPLSILGYSEYVIPGGENIGITINTEGLVVVGFYKVNDNYIGMENLRVGDIIIEIEGVKPNTISDMSKIIDENINDGKVNIKILRNNKEKETSLSLVLSNNIYKTGLYIKDKISGIGTLTYIDPLTKIYGALGHEIVLNEVTSKVEIRSGNIYESYVNGIDRSSNGTVGSKNATILYNSILGSVEKNTSFGIYGKINQLPNKKIIDVAQFNEIEIGKATIYTIFDGNEIKAYEIMIIDIDESQIDTAKSISFKIEDTKLLETSGGIIQGMSGSPIIQNGKIIGAVTHVVVDDVTKGYAIFIRTMLEEGEN